MSAPAVGASVDAGLPGTGGPPTRPTDEARLLAGGAPDGSVPSHCLHIWPWLKSPCQRFVLPTWLAITIFHHIFAWRALDDFELSHERCHVRQWQAHGALFIWRYFHASRVARALGKDQYLDNAFEVEAYGVESALRIARAGPRPA